MKKYLKNYIILLTAWVWFGCNQNTQQPPKDASTNPNTPLFALVNPFAGTTNSGLVPQVDPNKTNNYTAANVSPAAVAPWGMAAAAPRNTVLAQWGNSFGRVAPGYYHGEPTFYGFAQTILSGTGCHEMGHLLFLPTNEPIKLNPKQRGLDYQNEHAQAGYYRVQLAKANRPAINIEATATTRCTFYKIKANNSQQPLNLTFDMFYNIKGADSCAVSFIDNQTATGWIYNGGFCSSPNKQKLHFYIQINQPAQSTQVWENGKLTSIKKLVSADTAGFAFLLPKGLPEVKVKIGLSYVSVENAKHNLLTEIPHWDFEKTQGETQNQWNNVLSRIEVKGGSKKDKIILYTSLYRALLHPNVFSDVNGEYLANGGKKVKQFPKERKAFYTTFSLWDTYRTVHPLLTLLYPDVQNDMLATMVDISKQTGVLPKWELTADELFVMIGDPGSIVVADSYLKGLRGFDTTAAMEAMLRSANDTNNQYGIRPGNQQYLKYGYIPDDARGDAPNWTGNTRNKVWGSVATSLEYYLADFAIGQMANAMGNTQVANQMLKRGQNYKKLFDTTTNFMRPRLQNGNWYTPFNPDTMFGEVPGATTWFCGGRGFCESNAWQYSFFVPHDPQGLAQLMGKDAFIKKLNSAFEHRERFELFNEPDMSYPFLFSYFEGEEWRTQKHVRWAYNYYFDTTYAGIPGNDDCGTLSAWALFSAIGFYPSCPATNQYVLTKPVFDTVTLHLNPKYHKGNQFEITTLNPTDTSWFNKPVLNGKPLNRFILQHNQITSGGKLLLQ